MTEDTVFVCGLIVIACVAVYYLIKHAVKRGLYAALEEYLRDTELVDETKEKEHVNDKI